MTTPFRKSGCKSPCWPRPDTGLASDDVFYFGNAIGETGNSTQNAAVNAFDEAGVLLNPRTSSNPAGITDVYDINRDGFVNAFDEADVQIFSTTSSTMLQLINLSVASPLSIGSPSPRQLILQRGDAGDLILEWQGPVGSQIEMANNPNGPWSVLSNQPSATQLGNSISGRSRWTRRSILPARDAITIQTETDREYDERRSAGIHGRQSALQEPDGAEVSPPKLYHIP